MVNESNAAVPGVVVLLLDSASTVVAQALTTERGDFRLSAPRAGSFRTRTLRIGFRPTVSEPFRLALSQELVQRVVLSSAQFVLDTVNVRGRNECRIASESAAATYAVWEQVQAALTATQLTSNRTGSIATTISTTVQAMAKPVTFNQGYSQCSSKGELETRLLNMLKAQLQR